MKQAINHSKDGGLLKMIRRTDPVIFHNDYTPDGRKLYSLHVSYIPKGNQFYYRISIKDFYIDDLILRSDTALLWKFSGGYVVDHGFH